MSKAVRAVHAGTSRGKSVVLISAGGVYLSWGLSKCFLLMGPNATVFGEAGAALLLCPSSQVSCLMF